MTPIAAQVVRTSIGALVVAAGVSIGVYASRAVGLPAAEPDITFITTTITTAAQAEPQTVPPPASGSAQEPAEPAPAIEQLEQTAPPADTGPPAANAPSSAASAGCAGTQPGPNWICIDGEWILPGAPPAVDLYNLDDMASAADLALLPGAGGGLGGSSAYRLPGMAACTFPQPGPSWVCRDGSWVKNGANGNGPVNGNGSDSQTPGEYGSQNGWLNRGPGFVAAASYGPACQSAQPASNWRCHNGTWMPALPGASTQTTYANWTSVPGGPPAANLAYQPVNEGYIVPPGTCVAASPGANYACVNGAWVIR